MSQKMAGYEILLCSFLDPVTDEKWFEVMVMDFQGLVEPKYDEIFNNFQDALQKCYKWGKIWL